MVAAEAIVVRVVDSPGDLKHANFKRVYRGVLGQRTTKITRLRPSDLPSGNARPATRVHWIVIPNVEVYRVDLDAATYKYVRNLAPIHSGKRSLVFRQDRSVERQSS